MNTCPSPTRSGPLSGLKVLEFAGIGPGPFCGMLLADMGAEVTLLERAGGTFASQLFGGGRKAVANRGKKSICLDLKNPEIRPLVLRMIAETDVLLEGFRPGVMERLGFGPEVCLQANPRLVYGRMTGWGQTGPLASTAGHDINYLSLSGALHAIGEPGGKPVVPLNLVADCGGGAMLLVVGVLAALLEARSSGRGQVVDAAMTDGSALLMTMMYTLKAMGQWNQQRGSNLLDGGAHFYDTYRCADGKYVSIGPIEPQFYALFLHTAGITDPDFAQQWDRARWPELKARVAAHLATRPRDEWCELFAGSDACVAPVLDMDEAPKHPHNQARGTFIEVGGVTQPAPAPRFSRSTPARPVAPVPGVTDEGALAEWGFSPAAIEALKAAGAI